MTSYTPPLQDMLFLLRDVLKIEQYSDIPTVQEASDDLIEPILIEAGKVASELLHPLNEIGDRQGCRLENGKVITPDGFHEAYKTFTEGGWASLACDPNYDGQGMPIVLGSMVSELMSSANMAFAMYPGLTHGAYSALHAHGSEEQKKKYLPKLTTGEWTGTMNLTEPHCGTDLGLLRTKAEPNDDGSFNITGQKIFISAGDHEMAENIIHLVLARTPDAPQGVKGISLFIVPKKLVGDDGTIGDNNTLSCGKLEEKMGIHGNATCVMNFDGAQGWLVGEKNMGLKAMFVMMNEARIGVGIQGLSQSEIAFQNALAYAKDRTQGRSLSGVKEPEKAADPIIVHPDIRRILMSLKAFNEAARSLVADVSLKLDLAHHHPDEAIREKMDNYVSLLTPIVKGYLTDKAFDLCVEAQQVLGGHGYIQESGMDQFVRDARIAMIYEGANGIQALDLVGRKIGMKNGQVIMAYLQEITQYTSAIAEDSPLKKLADSLNEAKDALQTSCMWLMQNAMADKEQAGATATNIMHLFGITALAYEWVKMANIAHEKLETSENKDFYDAKIKTADFFMDYFVSNVQSHLKRVQSGKSSMMAISIEQF